MWVKLRLGGLLLLAASATLLPKLALPAGLLTLLGLLSLPELGPPWRRRAYAALALSAIGCAFSFYRFIVEDAMLGMVSGGRAATSKRGISMLRQVVVAEDAMRRHAAIDPDEDGVGSAGLVGELAGVAPLRGVRALDRPMLSLQHEQFVETPLGPAAQVAAYLYIVCLPTPDGGLTARPGDVIDDEAAERTYFAYAWPAAAHPGIVQAFFTDAFEGILEYANVDPTDATSFHVRYAGPAFPPPCDAALSKTTAGTWTPWRGKEPRSTLPGAR